jgi:hypothetical protein
MIQPATITEGKTARDKEISNYCYCVVPDGLLLLLTSGIGRKKFCWE